MPIASDHLAPALTVAPEAPAHEVARKMERHHLGYVVVVEQGLPVGLITDRDLTARVLARRLDPAATPAAQVMSRPLVTLSADEDLRAASRSMRRHGIRRLPIVGPDGRLVGMLVADELVRLVGREVASLADAVERSKELEAQPFEEGLSVFGKE